MKLITKTNRNYFITILVVLPISCVLLYVSLNYFISEEIDEKLYVDQLRIEEQLRLNSAFISMAPVIEVKEVDKSTRVVEGIRNVLVYDPIEKEDEPFRELVSIREINGKSYLIKVRHSIIEDKDFVLVIGATMLGILIVILTLLILLNQRLSLKLWKPFYSNISALKTYSFSNNKNIVLADSKIDEFQDLKQSLVVLTDKLRKDYNSLKEFTENASHEIQTPLSIISLNLEEILQEEHSEANYKKIYVCYQSVQRLSKLNERLLLLTKLDNNQFNQFTEVDFNEIVSDKIQEFKPLFKERDLDFVLDEKSRFIHSMDSLLANMVVINILSNVAKYATPETTCQIEISTNRLKFSNSIESPIDDQHLFERFKKGNDSSNSTGLGLSIVKRIIEVSDLEVHVSGDEETFSIWIEKK
ncbi:MAG: two-component system OmpR family sensor kinase [Crocinitomicaceae bacterium]|jgi:two-component system OmpR family sensor kinase